MHAWSIPEAALLVAVGCAAGFVNTAAGAGSLLSLRALMLLGFPAEVANATNRVPVLVQSTVAARGFDKAGLIDRGNVVKTAIPASLGAVVGAVTASHLPEKVMRWVLIVVLLGIAFTGLRAARKPGQSELEKEAPPRTFALTATTAAWLFVAGAYGGFLQAGVGLALLYALANVGGLDYVRANGLKVVLVAIFTVPALVVFVIARQVEWVPAALMSVGSAAGAALGVRYAVKYARQLRVVVVLVDVIACIVLVAREVL
jgi:uncharacterized membrane protein YfcA